MKRLDSKLARIRSGQYKRTDFIIADAKDGDMGPSLTSSGPHRQPDGTWTRYRSRAEFLDQIAAIVHQDIVDIMLVSASNLELLNEREVFHNSPVKPAIRANDFQTKLALAMFALQVRMLGKKDMLELTRILTMNVADLANDFFESDAIKGLLSLDATLGELCGGEISMNHCFPGGDEGDIVAFAERDGFADFELSLGLVQTVHRGFAEADKDRLRCLGRSYDGLA